MAVGFWHSAFVQGATLEAIATMEEVTSAHLKPKAIRNSTAHSLPHRMVKIGSES